MLRTIGRFLLALTIGLLVAVALQALLAPLGWGLMMGGPGMRAVYPNLLGWLLGIFLYTLIWFSPILLTITLIHWLFEPRVSETESSGS
ncbi:MAG: hypothetical protein GXP39_11545 [Chloroflexi bacterium]|nr:hypothetical protein [Chloroflexota bacterium]